MLVICFRIASLAPLHPYLRATPLRVFIFLVARELARVPFECPLRRRLLINCDRCGFVRISARQCQCSRVCASISYPRSQRCLLGCGSHSQPLHRVIRYSEVVSSEQPSVKGVAPWHRTGTRITGRASAIPRRPSPSRRQARIASTRHSPINAYAPPP